MEFQTPMSSQQGEFDQRKRAELKNIIILLALVFISPIGLILMWAFATWSKTIKMIVTFLILLPLILLGSVILSSMDKAGKRADSAKVVVTINEMAMATEVIYATENSYSEVSCTHPSLISFCSTIVSVTGKESVIHSSPDKYCIFSELPSGDYCCIYSGSTSAAKKTSVYPGGKGYCDGTTFICPY